MFFCATKMVRTQTFILHHSFCTFLLSKKPPNCICAPIVTYYCRLCSLWPALVCSLWPAVAFRNRAPKCSSAHTRAAAFATRRTICRVCSATTLIWNRYAPYWKRRLYISGNVCAFVRLCISGKNCVRLCKSVEMYVHLVVLYRWKDNVHLVVFDRMCICAVVPVPFFTCADCAERRRFLSDLLCGRSEKRTDHSAALRVSSPCWTTVHCSQKNRPISVVQVYSSLNQFSPLNCFYHSHLFHYKCIHHYDCIHS